MLTLCSETDIQITALNVSLSATTTTTPAAAAVLLTNTDLITNLSIAANSIMCVVLFTACTRRACYDYDRLDHPVTLRVCWQHVPGERHAACPAYLPRFRRVPCPRCAQWEADNGPERRERFARFLRRREEERMRALYDALMAELAQIHQTSRDSTALESGGGGDLFFF
ncbi:unnamed protein product [Zymoseptoria tritici ST99CH_3D7]|uniref:Uncharacterized protein n=1 Tax=Zymoseptoria tritici (strain ST99CH_3D7) TaxID=1276538 RepID=A0A1X7RBY4_ZYMT9|nr:unnamed protein product [Zymoseptoria tritici ST99CH_3D7]